MYQGIKMNISERTKQLILDNIYVVMQQSIKRILVFIKKQQKLDNINGYNRRV